MIDERFAAKLLVDPLKAADEASFDPTLEEQEVFKHIKAASIDGFSRNVAR